MRPAEYRDLLVDLAKNAPDVGQAQVTEGGKHPYAFSVTVGGREQRWQVIGQLADGAKHDTPTGAVEGEPPAWSEALAQGAADAWLAALIGRSEPRGVERLHVWSTEEGRASAGVTVFFRNGERAFLRLL